MTWRIELRRLLRERIGIGAVLILVAVCAFALVSGRSILAAQIDGRAALAADHAQDREGFLKNLPQAEGKAVPTLPNQARFQAVAPIPVLVDFSIGRAAFENYSSGVSMRVRQDGLFKRTQLENPELLARGRIDLGTVVLIVAPLLLIGLGYGVFTIDRDSGTARLILGQAGSPLKLLAIRSILRLLLVAIPIGATAGILLAIGPDDPARLPAAGLWLFVAALGLLVWWALILLVNSLRVTAESSALLLVGLWGLLVFAVPAALSAAAELAYPPPSRLELIATARAAEVGASTEYENDHPGLAGEDEAAVRASVLKSYSIGRSVDRAVTPLLDAFDESQARQVAMLSRLQFASPSMALGESLNGIAGTDAARFLAMRQATRRYLVTVKQSLAPLIEQGRRMTREAYDRVPQFEWEDQARPNWTAIGFLAALVALLGGVAMFRFRRLTLA